jgi:hypothetical protein
MDVRKIVRKGLQAILYVFVAIVILAGIAILYHTLTSRSALEEFEYERKIEELERGLQFPVPATGQEGPTLIPTDETFHPSQKLPSPST